MEQPRRRKRRSGAAPSRRKDVRAEQYNAPRAPPPLRSPRRPHSQPGSGPRSEHRPGSKRHTHSNVKPLRRNVDTVLAEASQFTPSLGVNPAALHTANNKKYTSLHHCCTQCTPNSKNKYYGHEKGLSGLEDILKVDKRPFRRIPYRWGPHLSYIGSLPMPYHMTDHSRDTLASTRVQEAIRQCVSEACSHLPSPPDLSVQSREERAQVRRAGMIISAMSSAVCKPLVRLMAWLLLWVFGRLICRLDIQKTQRAMLLEAQKRGVPMVFLPSHKSHLDYLIMTFVLFNIGVHIPRVASGDNLRLSLVSWLVTHLGGFFIKRKLDTSVGRDILYRKCLHEFVERILCSGENLEFFIEGSRSRSGKLGCPKAGLLSMVVDTVRKGLVEDILIVPVNISYDRIVERDFVKAELMGGTKKPETVMAAVRGAWSILTRNVGSVRVDFAQPFSLDEYLSKAVVSSGSQLELSCSTRRRSVVDLSEYSHRKLVTALSYHIVYDIGKCSSLTPTGMVAFLLLNKHREGVTVDGLVESYLQLEEIAQSHGRAVSYSEKASEAVHYALHYIRHLVNVDPTSSRQPGVVASGNQKLHPLLDLPTVFDLYHLSNQITPLLATEAIVVRSLLSVAREGKRNRQDISREQVLRMAMFLSQLMAREFILIPPCADLYLTLMEVVDDLISRDLLKRVGPGYHTNEKKMQLEIEDDVMEDSSPDLDLQVSSEPSAQSQLNVLFSMLEPLVESYWLSVSSLLMLPHSASFDEASLLAQLQKTAEAKAKKGLLTRFESCSAETLRNSLKILQDLGVLVPAHQNRNQKALTGKLKISDINKLMDIVQNLSSLRS